MGGGGGRGPGKTIGIPPRGVGNIRSSYRRHVMIARTRRKLMIMQKRTGTRSPLYVEELEDSSSLFNIRARPEAYVTGVAKRRSEGGYAGFNLFTVSFQTHILYINLLTK